MKGRVIIECATGDGASELAARLEKWLGDRGEGALYAATLRTSLREHAESIKWERAGKLGELNPCELCGLMRELRKVPVTPGNPDHGNSLLCRSCAARANDITPEQWAKLEEYKTR